MTECGGSSGTGEPGLSRLGARLPARVHVRVGDGLVPGRGGVRRGRPRAVHLGHVLQDARQGVERRHGRRGVRPLPPVRERPRPDGVARTRRVPLLDRVAAHPGVGARAGNPEGHRLLLAARRRTARARDQAGRDALPLGPAAAARGRRRLGRPRHRRRVRGVRRDHGRGARRPRPHLDDAQRAVVLGLPRLRAGRARARPPRAGGRARRGAPPQPRARPGDPGAPRDLDRHAAVLRDAQLPRAARRGGWRGRGDPPDRRAREPGLHRTRCCAASTRPTCSRTRHPSPTGRSCRTAISRRSTSRSTCSASTTTRPPPCGCGTASRRSS